ncbi:MAG: polyphosphate polymerase domain-containing protein [Dehalococcoidia bacterium]
MNRWLSVECATARDAPPGWLGLIAALPGVSLSDLGDVAVGRRLDRKFLIPEAALGPLLDEAGAAYRVLDVDGTRSQRYQTRYFDTPALRFYFDHHRGKPSRTKVRLRHYASGGLVVLEVKRHTGAGLTLKSRHDAVWSRCLGEDERSWLGAHAIIDAAALRPVLDNRFERVTLVSAPGTERATVDTGLIFRRDGARFALPGVAVLELKGMPGGPDSPLAAALRRRGVRPSGFSKYCIGMASLHPQLKQNAFNVHRRRLAHLVLEDSPCPAA